MRTTASSVLLLLTQIVSLGSAATPAPAFKYGFSECVDNQRTLYYYTEEETTCSADLSDTVVGKPPVKGLRCDVSCDRGYFLGANFSGDVPVSGCEKCPLGQYSLGGGKLYSKRTNAWTNPLPIDIHTDCVTRNLYTGEWQYNCEAWNASEDGSMVSSGSNSDIMNSYEATRLFSTLRVSATFVRDGSITFQYRVDAEEPYDGLVFQVDDDAVMPLISKTNGWREAVYEVAAGAHSFSWDYTKDYDGDGGEDKAFVKVIELVGTSFSDTYCHTCGGDMTMSGGSICAFCDANEYAAAKSYSELDFTCYPCPEGTFAPKGSIGVESCVQRRPCSTEDLVETFTPCVDGKRDVSYSWSDPPTCQTDLPGSISLPDPKKGVECEECVTGYYLTDENTCETCPAGQKLGDSGCEKCPVGQVVVNTLEYGVDTRDGWSTWPSIIDVDAAKAAGWKLTQNGLTFVAPPPNHNQKWNRQSNFPIPFKVDFKQSGFVRIKYELSNVPTFERDGTRAWLELEIDDTSKDKDPTSGKDEDVDDDDDVGVDVDVDDGENVDENTEEIDAAATGEYDDGNIMHLLHGGENGTFTEVLDFNVTSQITKKFSLMVRTTSPGAANIIRAKIIYLGFQGTVDGGGVACETCPAGYEAVDTDEDPAYHGCRICPAGTFAEEVNGVTSCSTCPTDTVSEPGAAKCDPCGANTVSNSGDKRCAASAVVSSESSISVTESSSSSSSAATTAEDLDVSYNISLLQSLVYGNESYVYEQDSTWTSPEYVSTAAVEPTEAFKLDYAHSVVTGLFRPLGDGWKSEVGGQILKDFVNSETDLPYVAVLHMLNPKDAGNYFIQHTGQYGDVQCSAPSQWKITSGGNRMNIEALKNGAGVKVTYTNGSPCRNGQQTSTIIHFVCDINAGTNVPPINGYISDDSCAITINWKTAYACPICTSDYFHEMKTSCSGGQQTVSYAKKAPCYGNEPAAVPVATCTEVLVLDSETMTTVYAAISVVCLVVLLLLVAIFRTHRKYRNAYNDFLYLKGKMPVDVTTQDDGSKETTFEFTPTSNAIHDGSSPLSATAPSPVFTDEKKEEKADDDTIDVSVQSV